MERLRLSDWANIAEVVGGLAVVAFALGPALLNTNVRSLGRIVDEAAASAVPSSP